MVRLFIACLCVVSALPAQEISSGENCSFQARPDEWLGRESAARGALYRRVDQFSRATQRTSQAIDNRAPANVPVRNFIDGEIFGNLAKNNVAAADVTSDEEFLRRIYLDLTGRIPTPADIRSFAVDPTDNKRDVVIDRLLYSPEFVDKWTNWMGDLLQVNSTSTNIGRGTPGRDAFNSYILASIDQNKSFKDIAYEVVAFGGNSYEGRTGQSNYMLGMSTPGGPIQDTYDTAMSRTATAFLGMAHYDCLDCHGGRGHLDTISLWASKQTRISAQQMSAFFARLRFPRRNNVNDPLNNSWDISDAATGTYDLNTTYGNRPNRVPVGIVKSLTPVYRDGSAPAANGTIWREAFAANMVRDPMFARNFANRLWKAFFNLGLVDPVDTLDPDRLDPANPPPYPWVLQANQPVLLELLAKEVKNRNYDLRESIRVIVQSSAYQLSSKYSGTWSYGTVGLYARHYPRRLDAEEVHDAIAKATGVPGNYLVYGSGTPPVQWAMQLPEPAEPRSNGAVAAFLNAFLRGNRDNQQRSQSNSILQQLSLLNDPFVLNRTKVATSPVLAQIAKISDPVAVVDELFLTFLSRHPDPVESAKAANYLVQNSSNSTARSNAVEDLGWVVINKLDFLFSY